jgi:hypothetical protein
MPRLDEVGGHPATHIAEADKGDFHDLSSRKLLCPGDIRATKATVCRPNPTSQGAEFWYIFWAKATALPK